MGEIDNILKKYGVIIVDQSVNDIKNKPITKYGAANASGKLAKSIRYEVDKGILTVTGLDYSYYVEKGRKPGKFPPKQPILDWIEAKGIVADISKESLAFLIQRKIAKEGTTAYQQGGTKLFEDILNPKLIGELQSDLVLTFKNVLVSQMKSALTTNV